MIERRDDITFHDYVNAILEHYKKTTEDMSMKEYSIDVNIYNSSSVDSVSKDCIRIEKCSSIAYCRIFVQNGFVIKKEFYYSAFNKDDENDFISNENTFMKFFNKNDNVFCYSL